MIIVTTDKLEGKEIKESLGVVKGEIVQAKNFGRDFMAGMKTLVGGEIKGLREWLMKQKLWGLMLLLVFAMAHLLLCKVLQRLLFMEQLLN